MKLNRWTAGLLLFFAAMCFSCASYLGKPKVNRDDFDGMIYDKGNRPVADATIILNGKRKVQSDINGRFVFENLLLGEYTVEAFKDNYEPLTLSLDYSKRGQILYLQMTSFSQLLDLADKALGSHKLSMTKDYLDRAMALKAHDPLLRYYLAVYYYYIKNYQQAIILLEGLLQDGYTQSYVHLLLADIYEFHLKNREKAIKHLAEFLKTNADPDVEERLSVLKGEGKKSTQPDSSGNQSATPQAQEPRAQPPADGQSDGADEAIVESKSYLKAPEEGSRNNGEINDTLLEEALLLVDDIAEDLSKISDMKTINQRLDQYRKEHEGLVKQIFYSDVAGNLATSPVATFPKDYEPHAQVWFTEAKQEFYYISDPYSYGKTGEQVFTISAAIMDGKGVFQGVLALIFPVNYRN